MKRIFGMMPSDEIEKRKRYKDKYDHAITIQAGPHGWTVIYADGGTEFKDEDDTTDNNFQKAYKVATDALGELTEIPSGGKLRCSKCSEIDSEC